GGMLLYSYRRAQELHERWQPPFAALARQVGRPLGGGPNALVGWAERWWNDRLAPRWLGDGPTKCVLEFTVSGFPVAVAADLGGNPLRFGLDSPPHHVVLLLAARLPRDTPYWVKTGDALRLRQEIERAGFRLEVRTGGLAVQAGYETMDHIRAEPARVAIVVPL